MTSSMRVAFQRSGSAESFHSLPPCDQSHVVQISRFSSAECPEYARCAGPRMSRAPSILSIWASRLCRVLPSVRVAPLASSHSGASAPYVGPSWS